MRPDVVVRLEFSWRLGLLQPPTSYLFDSSFGMMAKG
uniref:Uncharacterized protein n=1 Tax=Rhizophora mucronata TaxID=61149 RepID=A0A2P2LV93_RHIMU